MYIEYLNVNPFKQTENPAHIFTNSYIHSTFKIFVYKTNSALIIIY